jgi:histidyl-tRNA synthetase
MSLVYNYQQFSDIVYQAYLTKHDIGVVAAGGCYDFLLSHFSTVPTAPNAKVGASRFTTSLQEGYRVREYTPYNIHLTFLSGNETRAGHDGSWRQLCPRQDRRVHSPTKGRKPIICRGLID